MFRLNLLPVRLHVVALRTAHALRVRYWRLTRVTITGCRALVFDADGRVLLVRHTYGPRGWTLPGGGVQRWEDPVAAAIRELREETGCRFDRARLAAVLEETLHGAPHTVYLVSGTTADVPQADGREIAEARFFAPDALPDDLARGLDPALRQWLTTAKAAHRQPD